ADSVADASLRYTAWKDRQERLAHATLVGHSLAPAQPARTSLVPRSVVTRKADQRIIFDPVLLQRAENLPHTPVQLFHDVAVDSERRLSAKTLGRRKRNLRIGVRHV